MRITRRKPDHEAAKVEIRADRIKKPKYFHRANKDGGNRSTVEGNIDVRIVHQHPGAKEKDVRPDAGTVLSDPDEKSRILVEARKIEKGDKADDGSGRDTATASGRVEIFGRLRRKR